MAPKKHREQVKAAFSEDPGAYLVPAGILAEISYMIEHRLETRVLQTFIPDLEAHRFVLECGEEDLPHSDSRMPASSPAPSAMAARP